MSRLDPIIRLRKSELDEVRRKLIHLEKQHAHIQSNITELENTVEKERIHGAEGPEAFTLGLFMERAKLQREQLDAALAAKVEEIDLCRDDVNEAFRELKKFEVAKEQEASKAKKVEDKREQDVLDEIGTQKFFKDRRSV